MLFRIFVFFRIVKKGEKKDEKKNTKLKERKKDLKRRRTKREEEKYQINLYHTILLFNHFVLLIK